MESSQPPSRSSSPASTLLVPLPEKKIQFPEGGDRAQTVHVVALPINSAKGQDLEASPGTSDPTLSEPDAVRKRSARKRLILGLLVLFALATVIGVTLALALHPHNGDSDHELPDSDHRFGHPPAANEKQLDRR
ncbi:hypothetical protein EXIGLDRAFT_840498 [Exidia glandulosa HHB12029]|uniref:Uncharacterized protein n=1 Tax=Exidia glandulosa HHB12029 TaxID=1314781 RepID=A0A165EEV8_EXIGL|nr:hypothetical protein EXIGLDRAFT_840498 [Exidia glandulosa HHB12029]